MKKAYIFHDGKKLHIEYSYLEKLSTDDEPREIKEKLKFEKSAECLIFLKGFLASDSYSESDDEIEIEEEKNQMDLFDKEGLV